MMNNDAPQTYSLMPDAHPHDKIYNTLGHPQNACLPREKEEVASSNGSGRGFGNYLSLALIYGGDGIKLLGSFRCLDPPCALASIALDGCLDGSVVRSL